MTATIKTTSAEHGISRVTAGVYTLVIPANGVAVLYEADEWGNEHQLPGGSFYLDALVQFAGEVIRLNAMLDQIEVSRLEGNRERYGAT